MVQNDYKQFRETIHLLERHLDILQDTEFSCCQITLAQCHALVEIGRAESLSLGELARLINLENSTVSRTVNNLVDRGLAAREIDPGDRRYVVIRLTEKGKETFQKIETGMDHYFREIFSNIPEGKKNQILESLSLIVDAVSKSKCCKEDQ